MDLRRMLRTMRYSQLEQHADPKTGERLIPPSIKFATFLVLVVAAGALLFMVGQEVGQASSDTGSALDDPGTTGDGNNTTEDENTTGPQPMASPRATPPGPILAVEW